eukprot:GFUD01035960.1.p1 GENE.GFUD01035960.1~~GFUD01035960.1.p1  ORF type:complete len:251 (+),score=54.25 GFUD01035960.1:37-789(+)
MTSFLLLVLPILGVSLAPENSIGSCQFTRDCQAHRTCQNIADAGCVCNFGNCVISGDFYFRGTDCNEFTDCACKNKPESCFCRGGFCQETRWECHEAADCKKLSKCKSQECACTGNLCESDCAEDGDCEDFHCNKALGYYCKCENNLCAYKQKAKECKSITDCVSQGKCSADKPCACTQDYCTLPWWVAERDQPANCRSDQDCENAILSCQGNKCSCLNKKPIDDEGEELVVVEMRGTCGSDPQYIRRNN